MRVFFGTRILDLHVGQRHKHMGPEWVKRRLEGRIAKPRVFGREPLTSTIRQVVESLLDDADVQKVEDQRFEYSRALCAAVAYDLRYDGYRLSELLESNDKTEGSFSDQCGNILAGAAAVGNIPKLQTLLSQGADPNVKSQYFGFALQNAARLGLRDIVSLLMEYNTKTHSYASSGEAAAAALRDACEAGQEQIVRCLLYSEYEMYLLHAGYEDAVVAAAGKGHVDIMWLLLSPRHCPNKEKMMAQALFRASAEGYLHVVQTLLDSGLDVNTRDLEGKNSLHEAARGGHARVVRLLLDRGAWYYESHCGDPLYLAARNGHEDVVQMLLDGGANIGAEGRDGCVITQAAKNGETRMIRFLLDKGLDLNAFCCRGRSRCGDVALEFAAGRGHEDTVRLLVGLGVDVDGGEYRDSPMIRAMVSCYDDVVKTLLELGAKEVDPLKTELAPYFTDDGKGENHWRP
jgi:ankyrin repeat protein